MHISTSQITPEHACLKHHKESLGVVKNSFNGCYTQNIQNLFAQSPIGAGQYMGQKDQDGYYAEMCHFFFNVGA